MEENSIIFSIVWYFYLKKGQNVTQMYIFTQSLHYEQDTT